MRPPKPRRMPEASAETRAVATVLHELRLQRSLTLQELAFAAGLDALLVADLEAARRDARLSDLVALARALETSVEAVLRRASL